MDWFHDKDTYDVRMVESFEDVHLPPYRVFVVFDFLLRDDLERDISRLAGAHIMRSESNATLIRLQRSLCRTKSCTRLSDGGR